MRCSRPGRAGNRPGADEVLVALVGHESARSLGSVGMIDVDFRQLADIGNQPRLGAVGDVAVAEKDRPASCI